MQWLVAWQPDRDNKTPLHLAFNSHASYFPLFPVFMLSYANWLLAVASYLP